MVKKILTIVLVLINSTSIYSYDWHLISDSIKVSQEKICPPWCYDRLKEYAFYRSRKSIINNLNRHAHEGDTLLFMEHYRGDRNEFYSSIWVKDRIDSFISYNNNFHIYQDFTMSVFSEYSRFLCNRWDVDAIRKEEDEHPEQKDIYVMATRVILREECTFSIDCIFFKCFYDGTLRHELCDDIYKEISYENEKE